VIQKTDSENTRIPGIPWIPWPQNDTFLVDTGGYCHRFLLRKGFIHSESMNRHNWCQQVFEEEPEALLFRAGLGGQDANLRVLPANNLVVKRQFRRPRCAPSSQASFPSFRNLSIELRESQVFRKHSKLVFTAQRWRWFEPQMPRLQREMIHLVPAVRRRGFAMACGKIKSWGQVTLGGGIQYISIPPVTTTLAQEMSEMMRQQLCWKINLGPCWFVGFHY